RNRKIESGHRICLMRYGSRLSKVLKLKNQNPLKGSENRESIVNVIFSGRMLVALLMGFSCGLPLLLTISVLQAWMKEEGLDL
ncbi:hypothetical protein C6A37_13355, partial [Desulfobacteraceae bacterium SEEP-SAG9]